MSMVQLILSIVLLICCLVVCVCCALRENDGKKGLAFGENSFNRNASAGAKKFKKNYYLDRVCTLGVTCILALSLIISCFGSRG